MPLDSQKCCKDRRLSIDLIKTISIIAVVLYHLGILKYGYLGVEAFFLISGYNFIYKTENSWNGIGNYLLGLIKNFYPSILAVCIVSLILGAFVFPIYYKTISYNIIAALPLMSNLVNVLRGTDYWNTSNVYNPIMHLWYICVLIHSLAFLAVLKAVLKSEKKMIIALAVISAVSLALCFITSMPEYARFYLMPFRLYEICLGGLLAYLNRNIVPSIKRIYRYPVYVLYAALLFVFIFGIKIGSNILNIVVLLIAAAILRYDAAEYSKSNKMLWIVGYLGRASYYIYIWHQAVFYSSSYSAFQGLIFLQRL